MKRLIGFEWKKLLLHRSVLVLLLAFTALNCWKVWDTWRQAAWFADSPGWGNAYWSLYEDYAGPISPEKARDLMALYQPLADSVRDQTFNTAYNADSLTGINAFSDYLMLRRYYVSPFERFTGYASHAAGITGRAKENVALFSGSQNGYEVRKNARIYLLFSGRSIEDFAYTEMYARLTHYGFSLYLSALLSVYGLTLLFAREKESSMDLLLLTAPNGGRRTLTAKLAVGGLFVAGTSLWFSLMDFFCFAAAYGTWEGAFLPVYALLDFSDSPLSLSLWQYTLLSALTRVAGFWLLGALYLLCSCRARGVLFPFLTGTGAVYILLWAADAFAGSTHIWRKALNPASLLHNQPLYGRTEFVNILGQPFLSYEAALLAAFAALATCLLLLPRVTRSNKTYTGKSGKKAFARLKKEG